MINVWKTSSLYKAVSYYFFISLCAAFLVFGLVSATFYASAEKLVYYEGSNERFAQTKVIELQRYIDANELDSTDGTALSLWNDDNWYISLRIFTETTVFYDSFITYSVENIQERSAAGVFSQPAPAGFEWNATYHPCYTFPLEFSDAKAKVTISGHYAAQYQKPNFWISSVFFALTFICVFFVLFRRKIIYIHQIEQDIALICNEDLTHQIPVLGHDELASLAAHINEMSASLQEQLAIEADIRKKNDDVIASISHDLRTPLTSVICYLDLLKDKKYENEETLTQYLSNACLRAYQIKGMTDELFRHSVQEPQKNRHDWQTLDGNQLIFQIFSEFSFGLEENGFLVDSNLTLDQPFFLRVDLIRFHRIFDNLASNILKYASKAEPIKFRASLISNKLHLTQTNRISPVYPCESFGIGLSTCKSIVTLHNGALTLRKTEHYFEILIVLPLA